MSVDPESIAIVLARVDVKLDQLLESTGDHEQRLRALETRRWPLPSLSAVIAVTSLATSGLGMVIH